MKMKLSRLLIAAVLLVLPACSKKTVEVTGQLFVVTEGRDNIKMGGVQVRVIPDEDFVKAAKEVLPWLEAEVQKEMQARTDADHLTALIREIVAMEKTSFTPVPELPEIRKALVEESKSAENLMERALAAPFYQQAVAKVLNAVVSKQEVTTDADGRFSTLVTGKTWFIAVGDRAVGDDKESYLWIKGFEPAEGSPTASLVISNESDIESDDQFHSLISGAAGKAGELEVHRAAGKAAVSEKMRILVASKREAVNVVTARSEHDPSDVLAGREREFEIASGVKMSFCWCPAGEFLMGSPESEEDRSADEDQVKVTLSKGFWMAKTEVNQAQWEAVMGENPSGFKGGNRPVESVSWYDTQEFLRKLNARLGNADGGKMVLPTEAQWEYAARAGQHGVYAGGGLDEVAWFDGNSGDETHPVGTKKANAWGLHDMSGNVWEWCQDWYDDELPGGTDPSGPESGTSRLIRGGSWRGYASGCRVAGRNGIIPAYRGNSFGFRVARISVP